MRYPFRMSLKVGDWVTHAEKGAGQIQEDRDRFWYIRFVTGSTASIIKNFVNPGQSPAPDFKFPFAQKPAKGALNPRSKSLKPAFTFEHLLEQFISVFPKGFEDPSYLSGAQNEREYKLAASDRFVADLNEHAFRVLLDTGQSSEIWRIARSVATDKPMNLINPVFEFPHLTRALQEPAAQGIFARALFDVLYGREPPAQRFERYVTTLDKFNSCTWSIATFFQFIATRGESMFMKISIGKFAAEAVHIDLMYSTVPNFRTLSQLQKVSFEIKSRLEALGHQVRDGIDVQSFMFVAWNQLVGEPVRARKSSKALAAKGIASPK